MLKWCNMILVIIFLALVIWIVNVARASAEINVEATVTKVIDGDTLRVVAKIWPGIAVRILVRVDGVDTPELRGKCEHEKVMAIRARDRVRHWVNDRPVLLVNVRNGKYAGRVVARVMIDQGDLAKLLIIEGLGREYHGGKRGGWCG